MTYLLLLLTAVPAWNEAEDSPLNSLTQLLGQVEDAQFQLDLLQGMHDALRGQRKVKMPTGWTKVAEKLSKSPNAQVREKVRLLSLVFNDPKALQALRKTLLDSSAPAKKRIEALEALVESGAVKGLAPRLHPLLKNPAMRGAALRALAADPHPQTPELILQGYVKWSLSDKQNALATLASRSDYAMALLERIERNDGVDAREIDTFTARQIRSLNNPRVLKKLDQVWGEVRPTNEDRKKRIAEHKQWLTPAFLKKASLSRGREIYKKTCQQCHRLYGEGGQIGPDLTGSNRDNLHYVLENVLDPSAVVAKAYQLTTVVTIKGRVLSGIVQRQPNDVLSIQTPTQKLLLPLEEVEELQPSKLSMMPDGLFEKLSRREIGDLIAYLANKEPTP